MHILNAFARDLRPVAGALSARGKQKTAALATLVVACVLNLPAAWGVSYYLAEWQRWGRASPSPLRLKGGCP